MVVFTGKPLPRPHKVFTPVFSVHFFQCLGSLNRLQNCKLITLAFCGDCCLSCMNTTAFQNISGFHSFVSFHSKSFIVLCSFYSHPTKVLHFATYCNLSFIYQTCSFKMSYTLCIGFLLFVNVHVKHSTITLTSSLGDNAFTVIYCRHQPLEIQ